MNKKIVCILFCLSSVSVMASSFDCGNASKNVEKLICSNQNLSTLDEELSANYKAKADALTPEGKQRIKSDQLNWLKYARNRCVDVDCLKSSYADRLHEINTYRAESKISTLSLNGENYTVVDLYKTNQRNESFNKSGATKLGGQITTCVGLVDVPVGTAHGNHSFGGYCFFQRNDGVQLRVQICDDDMVGHFKMEPSSGGDDINILATFVVNNCFGG